jgi:hypothetical protein
MNEPAAWIIHGLEDEYYGRWPDIVRFSPLSPEEKESGMTATPLFKAQKEESSGRSLADANTKKATP